MIDHSSMKLGKRPRRHDVRTLKLARYLTGAGQAQPLQPPPTVDYTHGINDWGMMLNDRLGCCTIAAVGHAVQAWTANALGRELTVPDSTILAYYEKWDGYNPANPSTDQGGVELDVLNEWRQQGFDRNSLDAYVAIGLSGVRGPESGVANAPSEVQGPQSAVAQAIWLFGGLYIGVELPITAQNQDVWDVPANPGPNDEPGSWGGHAIYLVGYDFQESGLGIRGSGLGTEIPESTVPNPGLRPSDIGLRTPDSGPASATLTCITWGKPKMMTWAWFEKYCSEAYALVSKDWLESSGVAPSGFDLAALENDLKVVTCP